MEISLATNGTLINDEVVEFIKTLSNPTLSISLDGGEQDRLRFEYLGATADTSTDTYWLCDDVIISKSEIP